MASFTNFATLSYNGGTINSNTVTGEILETVTAEKTAVTQEYGAGDSPSYVISLVNSGVDAVTGLTVTDDLGAYEYEGTTLYPLAYRAGTMQLFVNGVLQPAPTVTAGPPLAVSGLEIPAGGSAVLVYETELTGYAPLAPNSQITNTAVVSGGGLSVPVTVSATVVSRDSAALQITKAFTPAAVKANGVLSYSFQIINTGNTAATAADEITLSDTFDPILGSLQVSLDGQLWTQGVQYSYDQAGGVFSTFPGLITVPAAVYTQDPDGLWSIDPGSVTLTITGIVRPQS